MPEEAIKIFYSYSRKDLDMRNILEDHLSALREANRIKTWHDLELEAGTEWEPAILHKLNTADIILLLVSRNFIASKYCYGTELKLAIARHDKGTARVIPIILRPCDWNHPDVPFSKLNVLPTHAKAITSWADQEEAFTIVAQRIRETVDQLRAEKQAERQAKEEPKQHQTDQKEAAQRNQTANVTVDELASKKGVDYTRLRNLLKDGKWKEADQETADRMCEVMRRKLEPGLRIEDIQNFPCIDLRTIDQLWVRHSNGKFGFSVQKEIWQECGSPIADNANWEEFGEIVGWKKKGILGIQKDWKYHKELTFDISAPRGHLPVCRYDYLFFGRCLALPVGRGLVGDDGGISSLASRLVDCSIPYPQPL